MLLDIETLLSESREERRKAGGPGGQKRNKTSSTVRLTHLPTGITASSADSRSLEQNRDKAAERLQHRLVVLLRDAIDLTTFAPPAWFSDVRRMHLRLPRNHKHRLALLQLVLDVLHARGYALNEAADVLGVTMSQLVGVLQRDPPALSEVNRQRTALGLKPLGM